MRAGGYYSYVISGIIHISSVADLAMVPRAPWNPPFGLDIVLTTTDDRQSGTPSLATELKKTVSVAHLSVL